MSGDLSILLDDREKKDVGFAQCPDCGRFSKNPWQRGPYWGHDGMEVTWGGVCGKHGAWQEWS